MKLIIVNLIFLVASCHNEETTQPDPPIVEKPIFEKIWSTRIYDAPLENVGSDNAYVYMDSYIVTGDHYSHSDPSLKVYDTKTGLKKYEIKQSGKYQQPGYNLIGHENKVIISDPKGIAAYDIEAKLLMWEDIHIDKNELGLVGQLQIYDGYVYKGISYESFYGPAHFVRYNINTGAKEKIVDIPIEGIWSPDISPPSFWIDNNLDTIMLFINGKSNIDYSPQNSPTDLWAYNISKKSLKWKIENVMEIGTNLRNPPIIYNDDVIFGGDWSIYSIDITTGKVNWRSQFPELGKFGSFGTTGLLLEKDKIYCNPTVFNIFCLNAKDGTLIWHKKNAPNCSPKMLYNDNLLITTSFGLGSIIIFDGNTGDILHQEKGQRNYYTDVVYDKFTDMYFVQDFAHAVGFKINKPK